jgi:hypothetical protein
MQLCNKSRTIVAPISAGDSLADSRRAWLLTLPGTSPSQTDFSIFCPEFRFWRWISRRAQVISLLANFGKEGSQQPNQSEN